jgi:hypothetical protein
MTQRMYGRGGRGGQYTEAEWQAYRAMKRHEASVSEAFQPRKDALMAEMGQKLITIGVAADKITRLSKLIQSDRMAKIQWSSVAMREKVLAIAAWYEEAIGAMAIEQIEANNTIHVWGE